MYQDNRFLDSTLEMDSAVRWLPNRTNHIVAPTTKQKSSGRHDSTLMDSGFLSGASLLSEEIVKSQPHKTTSTSSSRNGGGGGSSSVGLNLNIKSPSDVLNSVHTCDSGIDINEELSRLDLNCEQQSLLNDVPESTSVDAISNKRLGVNCNQGPAPTLWEEAFQQDEDGDNQLLIAVVHGFIEVVYSLVRLAPCPIFLDIQNNLCQTALHLSVWTHQPRVARMLLIAGASVDVRDRRGNTPLHLASQLGDLECLKSLLNPVTVGEVMQADLKYGHMLLPRNTRNLELRDYNGEMCVHLAAQHGHIDIIRHLYWYDADMNAKDARSGKTALHLAVERRDLDLVRFLVGECGCNVNCETYAGYTPYQLARTMRQPDVAEGLLLFRATPREVPDSGDSGSSCDDSEEEMPSVEPMGFYNDMRINGVLIK